MSLLAQIKTGVPEMFEQSRLVADTYGGRKTHWFFDMVWSLIRYGARPIDYVRFEFHKKVRMSVIVT